MKIVIVGVSYFYDKTWYYSDKHLKVIDEYQIKRFRYLENNVVTGRSLRICRL